MELMAEQPRKRWAIVIGGSIAGLFVGAFLRRIGWQVDIYERSAGVSAFSPATWNYSRP